MMKNVKGIRCFGKCIFELQKSACIESSGNVNFNFPNNVSKESKYEIGKLILHKNSHLILKDGVEIRSNCFVRVDPNATLYIGSNTLINHNCRIICKENINIGNDCIISFDCKILDTDMHKINDELHNEPIKICNHVWIGIGSIILKGVTIGDGAIIGAGSVVTHDIPPGCMAAGNPARVIKENVTWKR